jgi:hypothetical protein
VADVELHGLAELQAAFVHLQARIQDAATDVVTRGAAIVEARAKANFVGSHAKGVPHTGGDKPNVVTGTLRRSIRSEPAQKLGLLGSSVLIAPRAGYGRRVELGFTGTDSLGRRYTQRPYPYFTPAVDDSRSRIRLMARQRFTDAVNGR